MSEIKIPSSPEDRKKIREAVEEMSNSMARSDSEKEHQKEIVKRMKEEFDMEGKVFRKMATDYHKQQFDKTIHENESYETLYETIIKTENVEETE